MSRRVFCARLARRYAGLFSITGAINWTSNSYSPIRALDATTGEMKWGFRSPPSWVGTLATAGGGGLFRSDDGNFFVLDAETGKPLWEIYLGASFGQIP